MKATAKAASAADIKLAKREALIMAAITGICARRDMVRAERIAEMAVSVADAVIKEMRKHKYRNQDQCP